MLLLALIAGAFYWNEAEKEVRILCSMFAKGQKEASVIKTLETGNLLTFRKIDDRLLVTSAFTLNTESCKMTVAENGSVVEIERTHSMISEFLVPWFAITLTAFLTLFQVFLALGLPLGEYAWGGVYRELPGKLRIGSAVSALMLVIAILAVLSTSEILSVFSFSVSRIILTVYSVIFLLSIIGNLNSKNVKEKRIMIPMSIALFGTYLFLTIRMY